MEKLINQKGALLYSIVILYCLSCQTIDGSKLEGHWRAAAVIEEGIPLDLDLSEISFTFQDAFYSYYNTPMLEENGIYELSGNRLITTDTTRQNTMKKTVQVVVLTQDSLHLRMNASGREQILKLYRTGESEPDEVIILD